MLRNNPITLVPLSILTIIDYAAHLVTLRVRRLLESLSLRHTFRALGTAQTIPETQPYP